MGFSGLTNSDQMNNDPEDNSVTPDSTDKWRWAIYIGLLFLLVSNSYTYSITQKLLGSIVNTTINGIPSAAGIVIHCVVFVSLVRLLMNYKL